MACIKKYYTKNGQESKLFNELRDRFGENRAEEIYLKTHTPQFKEWFGDWETGKSGSGIDENGEPRIYWHGTNQARIESFIQGVNYFSSDYDSSQIYAEEMANANGGQKQSYPVFINITNDSLDSKEIKVLADQVSVKKSSASSIKSLFNDGGFSSMTDNIYMQKLAPDEIASNLIDSAKSIKEPSGSTYDVAGQSIDRVSAVVDTKKALEYHGDEVGEKYADFGTRYHKLVENLIKSMGEDGVTDSMVRNVAQTMVLKDYEMGFAKSMQTVLNNIHRKGGRILSEVRIANTKVNGGTGVAGTVDIIHIRKDGFVDIYDIKTAHETPYKKRESEKHGLSKDPWDLRDYNWYKAKRYSHQLSLYAEMLQTPDETTGRSSVAVQNIYVIPVEVWYDEEGNVSGIDARKTEDMKQWSHGKKMFYNEAKKWSESIISGKKQKGEISGLTTASTIDEFLPKALGYEIGGPNIDRVALNFVEKHWGKKKFKLDNKDRDWVSDDKQARVNQVKQIMESSSVKGNFRITESIESFFHGEDSEMFKRTGASGSASVRLSKIMDTGRAVDMIPLYKIDGFEKYDDITMMERADGTYDMIKMTWESLDYRFPIAFKEGNIIRNIADKHGELSTNSILGNHIRPEKARSMQVKLENTLGDYHRMRMGMIAMEIMSQNPEMKINRIIVDDLRSQDNDVAAMAIPAAEVIGDIKKMYQLPNIKPLATGSLKEMLDNQESYNTMRYQGNPMMDLVDYMAIQLGDKDFTEFGKPNARAKIRAILNQFKNNETNKQNVLHELMNGVGGLKDLLSQKYKTESDAEEKVATDPEFRLLALTIAELQGITISPEVDLSKEFFGFISKWLKTPAATGRQTADKTFDLLRQFHDNVKHKIVEYNEEKKPYLNQLIRTSPLIKRGLAVGDVNVGGTDTIFAMGQSIFDDLFQTTTNKDGVTGRLPMLKMEGTAAFNALTQAEKEFIRYFNRTMKKYNPKWPTGLVPLVRASANTLLYKSKSELSDANFSQSVSLMGKTIKRTWESASHRGRNVLAEDIVGVEFKDQFSGQIVADRLEFTTEALLEYGLDQDMTLVDQAKNENFETNLEEVMTKFVAHYVKKEEYDKALPAYYVMRSLLKTYEMAYGFKQTEVINMLDTYVQDVIANIKMAEDTTVTGIVTAGVTTASIALLGMNYQVYISNAIQMWSSGFVDSITNTMSADPRFPGVNNFVQAGGIMIQAMNPLSDQELSHRLRLIKDTYLPDDVAILTGTRNQKTASGLLNTQLAFALDRSTEYTIRTQHLVAQMIKDGSFQAHRAVQVKDKDGFYRWKLQYDPKLDKRFEGEDGKLLYNRLKDSMDDKGELGENGELKMAYDWRLRNRLSLYINQQIGSFDKDLGSHMSRFSMAHAFTQFRTWFRDRYIRSTKLEYQSEVFGDYIRKGDEVVWEADTMKGILWTLADLYTIGKRYVKEGEIDRADARNLIYAANSVGALMLGYVIIAAIWDDEKEVPPVVASTFTRYYGDMLAFATLDPFASALTSPVVFISYYQRLFTGIAKAMSYGVEGEEEKMMEAFERVLPKVIQQIVNED